MQYCQTPPPSPCVHAATISDRIGDGKNPEAFKIAALMGNNLAIQKWSEQAPKVLSKPDLQSRHQQKAANNDSEVYYTLSVTDSDYQLDFYI
jgi:hypothetical protein